MALAFGLGVVGFYELFSLLLPHFLDFGFFLCFLDGVTQFSNKRPQEVIVFVLALWARLFLTANFAECINNPIKKNFLSANRINICIRKQDYKNQLA